MPYTLWKRWLLSIAISAAEATRSPPHARGDWRVRLALAAGVQARSLSGGAQLLAHHSIGAAAAWASPRAASAGSAMVAEPD